MVVGHGSNETALTGGKTHIEEQLSHAAKIDHLLFVQEVQRLGYNHGGIPDIQEGQNTQGVSLGLVLPQGQPSEDWSY